MCARFVFTNGRVVQDEIGGIQLPNLEPDWNIAPTDLAVTLRLAAQGTIAEVKRWGLSADRPAQTINARAETAAEKASFSEALHRRPTVIPADGFYEWSTEAGRKQPHFIHPGDGRVFWFAGLWTEDRFTILTVPASSEIAWLHDRMPAILPRDCLDLWLDSAAPIDARQALLQPAPEGTLQFRRVSREVNRSSAAGPQLILEEPQTQGAFDF